MTHFYNDPRNDPERDSSYDAEEAEAGRAQAQAWRESPDGQIEMRRAERQAEANRREWHAGQEWMRQLNARPAAERLAEKQMYLAKASGDLAKKIAFWEERNAALLAKREAALPTIARLSAIRRPNKAQQRELNLARAVANIEASVASNNSTIAFETRMNDEYVARLQTEIAKLEAEIATGERPAPTADEARVSSLLSDLFGD